MNSTHAQAGNPTGDASLEGALAPTVTNEGRRLDAEVTNLDTGLFRLVFYPTKSGLSVLSIPSIFGANETATVAVRPGPVAEVALKCAPTALYGTVGDISRSGCTLFTRDTHVRRLLDHSLALVPFHSREKATHALDMDLTLGTCSLIVFNIALLNPWNPLFDGLNGTCRYGNLAGDADDAGNVNAELWSVTHSQGSAAGVHFSGTGKFGLLVSPTVPNEVVLSASYAGIEATAESRGFVSPGAPASALLACPAVGSAASTLECVASFVDASPSVSIAHGTSDRSNVRDFVACHFIVFGFCKMKSQNVN